MDARHFDALTRALSATSARRHLLALLAALPLADGLPGRPDETSARSRRKRRKKRRRNRRKRCNSWPLARVCAGTCGTVKNNCGKQVDCGSCRCDPACPACQRCDPASRSCVADPTQTGEACGSPGQVCTAAGDCVCQPTTCQVAGKNCGLLPDGCGQELDCGLCPYPSQPCHDNRCGPCDPQCDGQACGAEDGCGGVCQTGSCPTCETCQQGACVSVANDTPCPSENRCLITTCQGGICTEVNHIVCQQPQNPCRQSTCNPATGFCVESNRQQAWPCTNTAICSTPNGQCDGQGVCHSAPVSCGSTQECCPDGQYAGICKLRSGQPCSQGSQCCSGTCLGIVCY